MPELPEVETVKKGLEAIYLNKVISDVEVRYERILANIDANTFKSNLIGQQIISFSRSGKFIIVNLTNAKLLIHLRMEGKFKFKEELIDKHSHVIFHFIDNSILVYHDVRKFGRIYYFNNNEDINKLEPLCNLGPEPLGNVEASYLYNRLKKVSLPIKSAILDQSILAGIGNIYADEILFASKIHPLTKASSLTINNCKDILDNADIILHEAIKDGGSTIKSFQSAHGVDGLFQNKLLMYGKANTPCVNCKTIIIKTRVNGRGTCYCPNCQKENVL